jgi:hypothetical protein
MGGGRVSLSFPRGGYGPLYPKHPIEYGTKHRLWKLRFNPEVSAAKPFN